MQRPLPSQQQGPPVSQPPTFSTSYGPPSGIQQPYIRQQPMQEFHVTTPTFTQNQNKISAPTSTNAIHN